MIAVMGGTFDPIHYGHLCPAIEIAEKFNLSQLRFIPSNMPPHRNHPIASTHQRLKMVQLAIATEPRFMLDKREFRRQGISYMYDTLVSMRQQFGMDISLALILGVDALQGFTRWHRWREILTLCHLLIAHRPTYEWDTQTTWFKSHHTQNLKKIKYSTAGCILFIPVTQLAISSSLIRQKIKQRQSVQYLLPPVVWDYIQEENLYFLPENTA